LAERNNNTHVYAFNLRENHNLNDTTVRVKCCHCTTIVLE